MDNLVLKAVLHLVCVSWNKLSLLKQNEYYELGEMLFTPFTLQNY